ncbi:MAG: Ryanodine receptor Ryr [Rhizobiales bacterium]|nr:Ryanodine receptor Ryr [Hyphomicrobiales bacterium]
MAAKPGPKRRTASASPSRRSDYVPAPIDTSGVTLRPALAELTERLAESTHDNWAAQRISEGWRYGPRRDDAAKTHPGLVAYADLTESEKDYDRRTALETLKAIQALGFRIVRAPQRRA